MIEISKSVAYNFENAVRGARNPMSSWDKMDSFYDGGGEYIIGENDMRLLQKLCGAGSDHRKFMRQIIVSADILAPLYWWKEFDTYKVGTTANSTSTMHRIHTKQFSIDDFSHDKLDGGSLQVLTGLINYLEALRINYNETKDKSDWYNIIQLLPSSYNQMRTCVMSYENLTNMYGARKSHKLNEWIIFSEWIEKLPYAGELICITY